MAQEDYNGPLQAPQGSYDSHDPRYPPPPVYNPSYPAHMNTDIDRTRNSAKSISNTDGPNGDSTRYNSARQPINEAVASAFTTTESSSAISPELLSQLTSQITANVIQQLQGATVTSTSPPHAQTTFQNSPLLETAATLAHADRSDTFSPEPFRASEEAAVTPASPDRTHHLHPTYGRSSPIPHRPMTPLSQASQAYDSENIEERTTRPRGPRRISTGGDATIIEKTWGALFTEDALATKRLGQFLRGIAVHLIEDYQPKHSLVITPDKLQRYYEETKLPSEVYPWQTVFDDQTSSISRMYRDFQCQHHLVQDSERLDKRPGIPGLTPFGFEKWATYLLRAHPDQEFERLAKTALEMPISNPDDRKERYPKEISRRLFPKDPDMEIRAKIERAMKEHCGIRVRARQDSTTDTEAPPPQTSYRTEDPSQPSPVKPTFAQSKRQDSVLSPATSRTSPPPNDYIGIDGRERNPYPRPLSDTTEEDGEDMATPQPIERERKPYVAQPGGGKSYEDHIKRASDFPTHTPEIRPARTISTKHREPADLQKRGTVPIDIHQQPPPPTFPEPVEARHVRSNSVYKDGAPRRQRSPSLGANGDMYGHRSESTMNYGSYGSGPSVDVAEDARRWREFDRARERNAHDKYDAARMSAYDPRDRDTRPRGQSTVGLDPRPHYSTVDDDYLRNNAPYQSSRDAYPVYPPTSYR